MKSNADNAGTAPAASPFVNPGALNAADAPLVEAPEFTFAGYLRFVLMLFVGFWAFGCPEPTGIVTVLSGFATPCFFILSGYFILVDDREHRLHKLKRKLIRGTSCMVFVFVLYAIINLGVFFLSHMTLAVGKRMIFNFVVLNLWPCPIGDNFWFIQAML
ncbi:MAG: hypothetical protein IKP14_11430, partial [Clostridiales bacterium]|nr:hypothetical protein [Clostridiales bacterium]